jgi:hypothetical protein
MAVGWTLSGLAASFLVAHPNTVAARRAATAMRRAFAVGDAAVWTLVALTAVLLPSLDRQDLPTAVAGLDWPTGSLLSGLLLVAFVARSALFPAQRWLVETTEAPSPISAFLHAGVVNGGGVLLLLLWPIAAARVESLIVV